MFVKKNDSRCTYSKENLSKKTDMTSDNEKKTLRKIPGDSHNLSLELSSNKFGFNFNLQSMPLADSVEVAINL